MIAKRACLVSVVYDNDELIFRWDVFGIGKYFYYWSCFSPRVCNVFHLQGAGVHHERRFLFATERTLVDDSDLHLAPGAIVAM